MKSIKAQMDCSSSKSWSCDSEGKDAGLGFPSSCGLAGLALCCYDYLSWMDLNSIWWGLELGVGVNKGTYCLYPDVASQAGIEPRSFWSYTSAVYCLCGTMVAWWSAGESGIISSYNGLKHEVWFSSAALRELVIDIVMGCLGLAVPLIWLMKSQTHTLKKHTMLIFICMFLFLNSARVALHYSHFNIILMYIILVFAVAPGNFLLSALDKQNLSSSWAWLLCLRWAHKDVPVPPPPTPFFFWQS